MLCVIIIVLCLWMQDHLHLMSSVPRVCLERFQTTVMLSSVNHTHSKMQMERKTHYLQIHAHAYGLFVFFSVRCEGRSVLRLGDSITDTLCEMTSPPSTTTTTNDSSSDFIQASSAKTTDPYRGNTAHEHDLHHISASTEQHDTFVLSKDSKLKRHDLLLHW